MMNIQQAKQAALKEVEAEFDPTKPLLNTLEIAGLVFSIVAVIILSIVLAIYLPVLPLIAVVFIGVGLGSWGGDILTKIGLIVKRAILKGLSK